MIGARLPERLRQVLDEACVRASSKPRPSPSPGGSASSSQHKPLEFKSVGLRAAGLRGQEASPPPKPARRQLDGSRPSLTSGGGWADAADEPAWSGRGASSGSGRRETTPASKGSPSKQGAAPPSSTKSAASKKRSRGASADSGSAGSRFTETAVGASEEPSSSNGATGGSMDVEGAGGDSNDTWGKGKRRRVASSYADYETRPLMMRSR